MDCDPTSPIAPARVNTLILPCGRLKQPKFFEFVERITKETSIHLGDISPDAAPINTTFSPLAFPNGKILFNFTLSPPNSRHLSFSPFEIFRQPMLVLCVADGSALTPPTGSPSDSDGGSIEGLRSMLKKDLQSTENLYPHAIAIRSLIFDVDPTLTTSGDFHRAISVPPVSQSKSTTMKTVMCDISAAFLAEMSVMANKIQQMNSIDTPSDSPWNSVMSETSRIEGSDRPLSDTGSNLSRPDIRASREEMARSTTSTDGISPPDLSRGSTPDLSTGAKSEDPPPSAKRDRKSLPSAATSADLAKSRFKLRQGILRGILFLHSGRWPDSLRELIENTKIAKEVGDHRWFARGLESVLIGLLCLASIGSQFIIPSICFASTEKNSSAKHTPSNSNSTPLEIRTPADTDNHVTIQNLSSAIPEIARLIVTNYTRPDAGKGFPTFIISDCMIRLGRLLAILQQNGGLFTRKSLGLVMSTKPKYPMVQNSVRTKLSVNFKREMSYLLARAMPLTAEVTEDTITDAIVLLSRIGSVLGHAGLCRKQSLVYKEMVSLLTPAFIDARKRGAAEVGIHPAASLSTIPNIRSRNLSTEIEKLESGSGTGSLDQILSLLWLRYGLQENWSFQKTHKPSSSHEDAQISLRAPEHAEGILQMAYVESFGSFRIRNEVIRLSMNFTEALPDFESLLFSISSAFNTVGPKKISALPSTSSATISSKALVRLDDAEQSRFAAKFFRVVEATSPDNTKHTTVPYWDSCLIRSVELATPTDGRTLTPRSMPRKSSTGASTMASEPSSGPFLHNSMVKPAAQRIGEIVIAGEPANFIVTLQNPFKFEAYIDDISFITNDVLLKASPQAFSLEPQTIQRVHLQATPNKPGELRVSGCQVRLRGCCLQEFLIFPGPWTPTIDTKIKHVGLGFLDAARRSGSASSAKKDTGPNFLLEGTPPQPSISTFTVIPSQPTLEVTKTSVPESGAVILEGQTISLSVVLTNQSLKTPCDFLSITFRCQLESTHRTPTHSPNIFTQRTPDLSEPILIRPGESMTFNFDVLGVSSITGGSILFDYAYLGAPIVDTEKTFYTQLVKFELRLSTIPMMRLLRLDALPLGGQLNSPSTTLDILMRSNLGWSATNELGHRRTDVLESLKEHGFPMQQDIFVLLLDLRNVLTRPLSVSFHLRTLQEPADAEHDTSNALLCDRYPIEAGQTARIALPLPKIQINDEHSDETGHKRLSNYKLGNNQVSRNNELIIRQALLDRIQGTWEDHTTDARGTIHLDGVALSPKMIEIISEHEMSVELTFNGEHSLDDGPNPGPSVACHELLTLSAKITNRSSRPLKGVLSLHPCLAGVPDTGDMTRHLAWTGTMRRELDLLEPGRDLRIRTGFVFSTPGRYDMSASVMPLSAGAGVGAGAAADMHSSERPALLGQSAISVFVDDV